MLLLTILLYSLVSKAQYESPLDTIPKGKKEQLIRLGQNTSVDLLVARSLKLFRMAFDSLQTKTKAGHYKIPDMKADSCFSANGYHQFFE